jgi:ubiquinone/menaquinone biosynthesis C-methylase UbiE
MSKKQIISYYSQISGEYDNVRFGTNKAKIISALEIEWVLDIIHRHKPSLILDAGCGTGRVSSPLLKKDLSVISLDAESCMVRKFREKVKFTQLASKANYVICDIESLPFRNDVFDAVISLRVIWHMPSYEKTLKEFIRVVRPYAVILVDFPSATGIWALYSSTTDERFEVLTRFVTVNEIAEWKSRYSLDVICAGHVSPLLHLTPWRFLENGIWNSDFLDLERVLRIIEPLGKLPLIRGLFAYLLITLTKK